MELAFWWDDSYFGAEVARCTCEDAAEDAAPLLAGLLTDDGGIDRPGTLVWLDAGIGMVREVRLGHAAGHEWHRETLGCRIGPGGVEVFWLWNDDEVEWIHLDDFERVLCAWHAFLVAGPVGGRLRIGLDHHAAPLPRVQALG